MNRIITDWNNANQDYPNNINLIELIEQQVVKTPNKIACYFANETLTFTTLNEQANQLAHFINMHVKGHANYIIVHLERKIESIIAILAILKSGNIYIPIDTDSSIQFIQQVIADCRVKAILSSSFLLENILTTNDSPPLLINLNSANKTIMQMPKSNLPIKEQYELAYVLYTSGTTGLPKGVKIAQKSLINLLFAMQKEINFTENECLLAITPITFDISAVEFYLPLLYGASFVFADTETRYNPFKIIENIKKYSITTMQATPITWQMLINANWKNPSKIKMLCGGEGLNSHLASKLLQTKAPLWNFYGPTETTIWSTVYKVSKIDKNKPFVAIGKPLTNTEIFVLDKNLKQVPLGVPGELHIGGDGLAIEYVNRPELTKSKFIKTELTKGKLYKTGDIVYFDNEKQLHFQGRIDTQIKIRGHRIEIEAIENILLEHPDIEECVVLAEKTENTQILVAYVILNSSNIKSTNTHSHKPTTTLIHEELNAYINSNIHTPILPSKYIILKQFPLTAHGKVDRQKIANQPSLGEIKTKPYNSDSTENKLEKVITEIISNYLKKYNINPTSNFQDIGLHSIGLVDLANAINSLLNLSINVIDLINYPTIRSFAKFLLKTQNTDLKKQYRETKEYLKKIHHDKNNENSIAIIGMACKFPEANNYNDFWNLILNKKNAISFFSTEELVNSGIKSDLIDDERYVPAKGILDDIDKFDANFFNISPAEAKLMDPQHRILLEQSWAAMEDAGYVPDTFPGKVSVFAGMNDSTYLQNQILQNPQILKNVEPQQIMLATSPHYLATKISYNLGLSGPSITISTACSTGLVAVNMAIENLREFKSDMAIAAAINITVPQKAGYVYNELGIFSPDGKCNVFAENSQGTVLSNGSGVIVLKRLNEALRDNDSIIAIIKGSAINNDGDKKSVFTSPTIDVQAKCIKEALKNANIHPSQVEFIEAHGSGTIVGDPIEVAALAKGYAFSQQGEKLASCAIGSVKANIGHTDTASGIAGLIKASLALYHKTIPANINYVSNNKQIDFNKTHFYVNLENSNWETQQKQRFAGVNSLGFGGTNAHIILQEAPNQPKTTSSKSANILIISAKTKSSLNQAISNIKEHLNSIEKTNTNANDLADCAYTLQLGRKHFSERFAITYSNYQQLIEILNSSKEISKYTSSISNSIDKKIIFGFVGQGAQYISMAYDIYLEHPTFQEIVDECCKLIQKEADFDLKEVLFPTDKNTQHAKAAIIKTEYAQPCLFTIEYALAKLLISLGITPTGMIGHSLGEYVAATIAGVFSLQDAIKLIIARSKLMAKTKPGVMLAIPLSKNEIVPYLNDDIDIAAQNAPNLCVISGSKKSITRLIDKIKPILREKNLNYQYLHTSHAFHSQYMDPILDEFLAAIKDIKFNTPKIPFISNISGDWITSADIKSKKYWAHHIRSSVLFSDGITNLRLNRNDIFIEIGPGKTLKQLIEQQTGEKPKILDTLPHIVNSNENSYQTFLTTISKLWLLNIQINWQALYKNEIRQRTKLPTYPFTKQSLWIEANVNNKIPILDNGLFVPSWQRSENIRHLQKLNCIKTQNTELQCTTEEVTWLIFAENETLFTYLKNQQQNAYQITLGDSFSQTDRFAYTINPRIKKHFVKLLNEISPPNKTLKVIHCSLTNNNLTMLNSLYHGTYCLLYLAQAFAAVFADKYMQILILTQNLYSVLGNENINPCKASILGPCKVIPQEHQNIQMKLIDVTQDHLNQTNLLPIIINEINTISPTNYKDEIAYRGNFRWIQTLQLYNTQPKDLQQRLKNKGTYIITGGLGGIGITLAEFLAKEYNANIILISRTSILQENKWQSYITDKTNSHNPDYKKIKKLVNIKNHAKSLAIINVSITNKEELSQKIHEIKQKHYHINGVIHAAGLPGMGIYELKSIEEYAKVLAPKLYGTEYLLELLRDEKLDFFALFSSTIAITGFPGQIDYCSANRVLDAYMTKAANVFTHDVFCVTINWQAWRTIGMAAESESILIDLDETNSLNPEDGCELFRQIINDNNQQVIISNTDLNHYDPQNLNLIPKVKSVNIQNLDKNEQHTHTINMLLDIWRNTLGISKLSIDDDFYDLGGNSLLAISLIAKIRTRFIINIPSTILFKERTIRSIADIIEKHKSQSTKTSPLVQLNKGNKSQPPIFFIHPIGGTVFCYLQLTNSLKINRNIYALQDPSIEYQKNIFKNLEEQATFYRTIIQKIQKEGPYYLCGSSYGASLAMEITYQLQKNNESIGFVGLIDGWGYTEHENHDKQYVQKLILLQTKQDKSSLTPQKQELFENIVSIRLKMLKQHTHKQITTPIYLFKARDILPEYKNIDDKDNHWSKFSTLPINTFNIPGDHNTMLEKPNVQYLAEKIRSCLETHEIENLKLTELQTN